jgi:hypothetical protein
MYFTRTGERSQGERRSERETSRPDKDFVDNNLECGREEKPKG